MDVTFAPAGPIWQNEASCKNQDEETRMGKTGRKRRARRKNKANHGKRPNA